jgi:hypothetical protein
MQVLPVDNRRSGVPAQTEHCSQRPQTRELATGLKQEHQDSRLWTL